MAKDHSDTLHPEGEATRLLVVGGRGRGPGSGGAAAAKWAPGEAGGFCR